ncbi:cell surface pattern recognition receptor signaling pathway [Halocaridina rubra]|uniref:Cell surface pattern recognition receptor signaling pathway n=1 Tax=Halocaridina rubra TaxID=373956 RepID=A0AAN9A7S1_HALRR
MKAESIYQIPSSTNILWFEVSPTVRNCYDVLQQGHNESGVYTIFPYDCCPKRPLEVYCDMVTDGGGWTVIQKRADIQPREDFFRTWMEYALGFGNLTGEFWLGLDHIHILTNQELSKVRFDMGDFENDTRFAEYRFFYVHDRSQSFKLEVNGYSGDAGDGFSDLSGQSFSTKDKDLDKHGDNCASR